MQLEHSVKSNKLCIHCNEVVPDIILRTNPNSKFCCNGCRVVFQFLQKEGLEDFYEFRNLSTTKKSSRLFNNEQSWKFLEDPKALENYSVKTKNGNFKIEYYLEGVHCAACIWLIEKLPQFVKGISSSRLDLSTGIAELYSTDKQAFLEAARTIQLLGYRPHPVLSGDSKNLQTLENRRYLIRIGVAATCTGNIMLLAVSTYAGAEGAFSKYFVYVSALLSLPVLLYSAWPFYKSAYFSFKQKSVSIDMPVSFALIAGTTASFWNLLHSSTHVFFDSLSMFVFLLLSSRYVLRRTQQKALHSNHTIQFLTPSTVHKYNLDSKTSKDTSINYIKPGDILEIRVGERIPADGTLFDGDSFLNHSVLTGESRLVKTFLNQKLYAGFVNESSPILVMVEALGIQTRIGKIFQAMQDGLKKRAHILEITDQVAKIFILAVIFLTAIVFLVTLKEYNFSYALNIALSMIVISCPCAIALASPLTFNVTLAKAAKNGIIIKNSEALERLEKVDTVILDKTGTLTDGNFTVINYKDFSTLTDPLLSSIIVSIEKHSNHLIAKKLVQYFSNPLLFPQQIELNTTEINEKLGHGISAKIENDFYEIKRCDIQHSKKSEYTEIGIYKNTALIGLITLGDKIHEDSKAGILALKKLGLKCIILSGDSSSVVENVSKKLNIDKFYAEKTPEEKSEIVKTYKKSLMVGDGANDAIAFASAYTSIAAHGCTEMSLNAADVFLTKPGLTQIVDLLNLARETKKVLKRNFMFSILYNSIGVSAAAAGKVNPIFAAILMPLSALSVFLLSLIGTKKMRTILKEKEL